MQPKILSATLALAITLTSLGAKPLRKFEPTNRAAIDLLISGAVDKVRIPGAVLWIERDSQVYTKAYGSRSIIPARHPMETSTVFDAASLTKVIATAPAIMILAERGKLKLGGKVKTYIPEFTGGLRDKVTLEHLLTHTSGLYPSIKKDPPWSGYTKAIALAATDEPTSKPGTRFRYSDINFILLGEIVRRTSGMTLAQFTRKEIFAPLSMTDTGFEPPASGRARIAPTEKVETGVLQGTVHDPTARRMGGVAGHAGLFTTASDLARFARMLVNGGTLDGRRVLSKRSITNMTSDQTPWRIRDVDRGYGWDIKSAFSNPKGTIFGDGTFGHTGWTGASIWIDPKRKSFVILLANRNHPFERRSIKDLQWELGTLAAEAIGRAAPK